MGLFRQLAETAETAGENILKDKEQKLEEKEFVRGREESN